jgi:threonine dehydratase
VAWAAGREDVRVVGVEATASRAVSVAVAAGRTVEVEVGPTLADGLAGNLEPGSVTVQAAARAELLAVDEPELEAAMRALARAHGLLVEGAGAAGVAALEAGRAAARHGETAIALVTGRNIALDAAARVLGVRTAA